MSLKEIHLKSHPHYGWDILASSFAILFFNSGDRYFFGVRFQGFVFVRTGSYRLAFILSAMMALIAFFCTVLIKEKRHLPRKRDDWQISRKPRPPGGELHHLRFGGVLF